MKPIEYERVRDEPDYAVRRIEALTGTLTLIEQGFYFPAPTHAHRVKLARDREVLKLAREALDPNYVSHDG
ncbi:MAG TPA: hypothetical protein VK631_19840 [Solirubrobacteraceae bacterium]|nr:hypothetical protein [Solirubrobacteraceae bacterium]